jgi:ABC-type antimicrobial peptide transport system permease subunit
MNKSYLKIAFRNLYRNKFYSIINIVGLGVAMALSVVGYVNHHFSQSFDAFHQNIDKIHLVSSYKMVNDVRQDWSIAPMPMGPVIREEIPGIDRFSRVGRTGGTLRYGEKVFNETFYWVDDDFFDMFTFPIILGPTDVSLGRDGLIITDELAVKYFGDENPVGKDLTVSFDGELEYGFVVRGVIEKPVKNSSMRITVCVAYENLTEIREYDLLDWNNWTSATFVQIENETALPRIDGQLQSYTQVANEANEDWEIAGYYLNPLTELAANSRDLRGSFFNNMHPAAIIAPSVTAFLVLLLACFNFVNTAIAFASRRLKEIGIRKVMGGMRGQLIRQFMGENLLLCLMALLVAAACAEIFVPAYDSLWPELSLSMNYSENLGLVGFFVALLFLTAVAAGAYPAFYVSAYNPASIFRGKQKLGGTNPLIRVLLTGQFALSMTAIIAAVILTQNGKYIKNLDLGFDRDHVLVVPINGEGEYSLLKSAVENRSDIGSIGGSRHLMGRFWAGANVTSGETETRIGLFEIGENYFATLGFELVDGRVFDDNLATDIDQKIIVNEAFVQEFGWESALGKDIKLDYADTVTDCRVIGVVKNFYHNGVFSKVRPLVLRYTQPERYRYISIKCDGSGLASVSTYMQDTWKRLFPNRPYNGFFQDDILADAAQVTESIRLVFLYIAVMVMIISGMGLFALVSLNIAKRTKEIGIRKVLGASVTNIGVLISREFVVLLTIGSVLASVMGYFLVDSLLSSIWAYYVDFGAAPFVLSAVLVFAVALMTVGLQVFSAAAGNPVDALRDE